MRFDSLRIEAALQPLAGLPLWRSTRAADMQCFHLGAEVTSISKFGPRKGQAFTHGEYALHVQCGWRIVGPNGIVVGWSDLYLAAGPDPYAKSDDWDWDPQGASRRDERVAAWLDGRVHVVERVLADPLGGCVLLFAGGFSLEILPTSSHDGEYWRLLGAAAMPHFVVTGAGIE
jgi:hypothetical protein